jgi:hypothetical protein
LADIIDSGFIPILVASLAPTVPEIETFARRGIKTRKARNVKFHKKKQRFAILAMLLKMFSQAYF